LLLINSDRLQVLVSLIQVNILSSETLGHGSSVKFPVTIVVISRLAYRKGIDLLVAAAPRICSAFPNVKFVIGADPIPGNSLRTLIQLDLQKGALDLN
jgi:glycosyltransferase involved in cell wall biosynthesis